MIDENIASAYGMPEITVVTDYSITPELAEKCWHMGEKKFYGDIAVDLQTYKNKFYAIPDFCFVFLNKETQQPVGYFIILPLTDDAIIRYMNGKLSYDSIKPGDLKKIEEDSLYNLFFDTKVMDQQYQHGNMAKLFFALFINSVIERARKLSFLNYILIDQFHDFTKTIAETMKVKYLKKTTYNNGSEGNLYGSLFNPKSYEKLVNYGALEFAYNNKVSKYILSKGKDLWEEYNNLMS